MNASLSKNEKHGALDDGPLALAKFEAIGVGADRLKKVVLDKCCGEVDRVKG